MRLKKFLIPFLLCSILTFYFIPNTYAATIWNWTDGEQLKQSSELYIARCTGQKSCYDITTNSFDYSSETGWFHQTGTTYDIRTEYQFYSTNDISFSANDYGVLVYFRPDQALQQNYMYSLTYYLCSNGNSQLQSIGAFTGKNLNQIMWEDYPVITLINGTYSAENRPFNNSLEPIFNTCTKYMYTFTSTSTRNYIGIKLNSTTATTQSISFLGYNLVNLGFTDYAKQEALQEIQDSVNSTNQELDGVKDEIGQTNDKLDNINDTLTDTSLNTGNLENSAGWLPPGPVDSILNLPLSLYQNLLDTLQTGSRSCPALNINLPYVDEVLTIPCLSDIFSRINGLNVFWTWVGTIAGAFILFNYLINLYKWVDATLTMRENNHFGGY